MAEGIASKAGVDAAQVQQFLPSVMGLLQGHAENASEGVQGMLGGLLGSLQNSPIGGLLSGFDTNVTVKSWGRHQDYGLFIDGGDQERLLYSFITNDLVDNRVQMRDFLEFNARTYHFNRSHDEHFVCHLAGHRDRSIPINAMRARFGLDEYLMKNS